VNLLLDTCAFLWLAQGSARLPARVQALAADPNNLLWLSTVSIWEIASLQRRGRIVLGTDPQPFVSAARQRFDIDLLTFDEPDAYLEPTLPRIHGDPLDRMLICQALARGLTILTPDRHIAAYPVPTAW